MKLTSHNSTSLGQGENPTDQLTGSQQEQSEKLAGQKIKNPESPGQATNPMAIHSLVNALFKYFATRMLTSGLSRWFVCTDPRGKGGESGMAATWLTKMSQSNNSTYLHRYIKTARNNNFREVEFIPDKFQMEGIKSELK